MKPLYFILILSVAAIVMGSFVIWVDKKDVTPSATEEVSELTPIPEGFQEIILDSGLRFGVPEEWEDFTAKLDVGSKNLYVYKTNDYIKKVVVERHAEGEENDWIIESGLSFNIEFSGNKIDHDYMNYFNAFHNSRCKIDIENKCSRINNSKGWSINKMNYNYSSQYIQYIYTAGKIIDNKAVSFSLYPPHNTNSTEVEKLLTQILETVAVVKPK